MENFEQNDGLNKPGASDANELGKIISNEKEKIFDDCLRCHRYSVIAFQEKLKIIEKLAPEEKIVALSEAHHEMELKESIYHQDYKLSLSKMIAFEKEKLERAKGKLEKERIIKEAKIKADEASNKIIPVDFPKLVVDVDEIDLAVLLGDFFFMTKNKKGLPIYVGERKRLAEWICAVIIPANLKPLNIITIINDLSTKEEIKEKIAKKALEDSKKG